MKQKLTLKQIAQELDLSISTVSKALRNSKEISTDTKEKVQAFAKLYNYRPNNIALSLKNRRTKTIAVLIPEIVHHFFSKVILGIEQVANSKGYNVIVAVSKESFDSEVLNMETLASGSIDGFILSVAKETMQKGDYHHFKETINQGMPIVMFDRVIHDLECDTVIINDFEAAKKATNALIEQGCKRILLITTKDFVSVGSQRTLGYQEAMAEHNMPLLEELILKIDDSLEGNEHLLDLEKQIEKHIDQAGLIDGIFGVNEIYAITAMKTCRKKGWAIPQDIKVIGFSDGILSKLAYPRLTTISQQAVEMGQKAASLLIDRLEADTEGHFQHVEIPSHLIYRESTQ